MILFGVRSRRKRLGTVTTECPQCHRTCSQAVARAQRWFTLFFIPIFPFSSKYYSVCSMCSGATKLDRAQAERLSSEGPSQQQQPSPPAPGAGDAVPSPPDHTPGGTPRPPSYGADPSDYA
jgi:hypothetical protein